MNIKTLSNSSIHEWNDFVDAHSDGTIFHRTEWKQVIERTFGYASHYIYVTDGNTIQGLLPLFHVKGWLVGNSLISTPFAVYGGILANNESAHEMLLNESKKLAEKLGARYVEFRHQQKKPLPELVTKDSLYATFINEMPEDREEIYERLPKEARRMVRKGRKNGLEIIIDNKELDEFYNIYAISVRKFGTPVFSKKLFQNCLDAFKENANFMRVYKDNKAIAAVLSFYYKDTVLPYYSGMLSEAKTLAPHNLMYLELMQHARERGFSKFDFGRSKIGTGAAKFKENMGFEPTPLPYQYYLHNGEELPNKNQTNPKYTMALNMWKRMPLSLTKILGPHVVRLFP
jgi:FemAB-related protein (PEP-CTERM system-associated)